MPILTIGNAIIAANVPGLIAPALGSLPDISSILSGATNPQTASSLTLGVNTSLPAFFNANGARADLALSLGGGVYGTVGDYAPTLQSDGTSLTLTINAGYIICGGLVQVTAQTAAIAANHTGAANDRAWIWALQTGVISVVYNSLTPPATHCVLLGSVTTNATVITGVDTSGVFSVRDSIATRITGDAWRPGDSPGTSRRYTTETASGSWTWTGGLYQQKGIHRVAADPSTNVQNGDLWYNTTSNVHKAYQNGVIVTPTTSGTAQPYDIGFSVETAPAASQVILRTVALRAFTLPASLTGSQAKAGTAATASTTFTFLKNGVSFATCVFSAAGTTGAYTSASGATFAAGDVLTVTAPASPDATLALLSFGLAGTY